MPMQMNKNKNKNVLFHYVCILYVIVLGLIKKKPKTISFISSSSWWSGLGYILGSYDDS